jgi:hypothetical protein
MGNGSICGCRKQIEAVAVNNIEIKKKNTPNGFARLYPGQ